VRHFGKSAGSMRHWQPLFSTDKIPQKTSYNSTVLGFVFFRAFSKPDCTFFSKTSRLRSLG
jgi:hypothetical protein